MAQRAAQQAVERAGLGLAVALGAGAAALIAPPAALLMLALLALRAAMRARAPRIELLSLAGPAFAALLAGAFAGLPAAVGVIFVWRVVSDARWSAREAAALARAAGKPGETGWAARAHLWTTPLYGVTVVAFTAPHMVAGLPLDLPHVPSAVPLAVGVLAAGAVFDWALRRAADWRLDDLAVAPAAHCIAHHVLFLAAFGLSLDVSAGLVALIAWRLAHAAPFTLRASAPAPV